LTSYLENRIQTLVAPEQVENQRKQFEAQIAKLNEDLATKVRKPEHLSSFWLF
jgi:hypothetical protein